MSFSRLPLPFASRHVFLAARGALRRRRHRFLAVPERLEDRVVPSAPSLLRTLTYDQITTPATLQNDIVGIPGIGGGDKRFSLLDANGNRAVVAATNPNTNNPDVWTVDAAGNTTRIDANVKGLVFLDISQDGSKVLEVINNGSTGGYDLRVANGNGVGQPQDVFTIPYTPGTGNNGGVWARLIADGSTIIFLTDAGVGPTLPSGSGVYSIPVGSNQTPHLILGKAILNSELASQLGGQTVGLLPGSPFDMAISADGSHVVFGANTSNGGIALVAESGGSAHLIGPINANGFDMPDIAISGDGGTVARYDTNSSPGVLSVYNFNGSAHSPSGPTLSVPGIPIDSATATISAEPIQLTYDGSKLLLGHTSLLLNTDGSGGFVQIGTNVQGTNFVGETFGQGPMTMSGTGDEFLFIGFDNSSNDELGIARLNPASPDPNDPQVSSPTLSTPYLVLAQPLNAPLLTLSAPVNGTSAAPVIRVTEAFEQHGLSEDGPNDNITFTDSQMFDDGTHGDVTAGDHIYTDNNINAGHITDPATDLGPRTLRISGVALDSASSRLHVTTVEYTGLTIVSQAPTVNTTTTVVSSANPSFIDQLVNFTATVTAATGTAAPVGAVQFYIDGKPDQLVSLAAGTGTSATATLVGHKFEQLGTFQVKAEYIPDPTSTFFESLGQLVPDQQVTLITTTTTVGASPNPSTVGQSVTFTATVTPATASPLPFDNGGTVQFQIDGSNFGSPQPLSGGMATISDSALGVGNHPVEAIYSGDSAFGGSNNTLSGGQTVNAVATAPAPVLTLPSPQTVSEGTGTPINMGSFTDASAGPWSMDMSWGDGSPDSTFNVSSTGTLPSIYHLYAEENTYSVTLKLTNTTDKVFASQTFQVIVSDPSVNALGGFSTQSAEGSSTGQQTLASFSDPGGPEASANYSSSINWGDGSPATTGTISSLIGSVNVNIYSGHSTRGGGTPFTGLVNSFTAQGIQFGASTGYNWHPLNSNTQQPLSDFGADITGTITAPAAGTYSFTLGSDDGSQLYIDGNLVIDNGGERNFTDATQTVSLTAGTHSLEVQFFESGTGQSGVDLNSYVVTGSHTYAEENTSGYNIATTINHDQSTAVTVNSTATVSDPAVNPTNTTVAVVQNTQFSGTVATFTDPGGPEALGDYSATINWGDGTPTSAGVISGPHGSGTFTVTGTHRFSQATTTASTISLSSASALAAAMGPGVPSATVQAELDAGNTTGLTFGAALDGAYGSPVAVPPGAPAGTPVINIAPGDGESGFFETTFDLPSNISGAQLIGSANVDDVGRVFLNGNAISPSIFSSDPARITLSGNAMFSTSNASFFHAGLNTLLIADSNIGGGSSGAAFWATVTYGAGAPLPVSVTIHHESAPDATTTSPVTVNPAIDDFDGDGKSDFGVFRVANAHWIIQPSGGGTLINQQYGGSNLSYIPVGGDYIGEGKSQLAVYNPSTSIWSIQMPDGSTYPVQYGGAGLSNYVPVPGDYTGNGQTEPAVYNPNTNPATWYIRVPGGGTATLQFGGPGLNNFIPVPGDYIGNGQTQLAVYQPSTANWFVRMPDGSTFQTHFGGSGLSNFVPVPGDYLGNGQTQFAVFQPSTANWYIRLPDGSTFQTNFGATGLADVPVESTAGALAALGLIPVSPSVIVSKSEVVSGTITVSSSPAEIIPIPNVQASAAVVGGPLASSTVRSASTTSTISWGQTSAVANLPVAQAIAVSRRGSIFAGT
jgi:hypothetical protein